MEAKERREVSIWENTNLLPHPADTAVIASPPWRELQTELISTLASRLGLISIELTILAN